MPLKDRQQKTNEEFIKILSQELREWCDREEIEESLEAFLAYMVKHNLIRQSLINRYTTINKYKEIRPKKKYKEEAIRELADLLPLDPRQIWNILGNDYKKFNPNLFKFP
jgi:hypothetical protein